MLFGGLIDLGGLMTWLFCLDWYKTGLCGIASLGRFVAMVVFSEFGVWCFGFRFLPSQVLNLVFLGIWCLDDCGDFGGFGTGLRCLGLI